MTHGRVRLLTAVLVAVAALLVGACSENSTGNDTVTMSGTVTLEGQSDHSGITVSIYRPVELDPEIVAINQEYPNIGVQISQATEFDHRLETPVKSTTTNAAGAWEIADVEPGTYNVVAEKAGYGWRYVVEQGGEESILQLELKAEIVVGGVATGNVVWEEGQHVIVQADYEIPDGFGLSIGPGVTIRMGANRSLTINGTIDLQSSVAKPVRFIPFAMGMEWGNLTVENNRTNSFSNLLLIGGGIRVSNSSVTLENSCLKNANNIAMRIVNGTLDISNCLFENVFTGIQVSQSQLATINNCIFQNNSKDVSLVVSSSVQVANNHFFDADENLELIQSNAVVRHNLFQNSLQNISVADVSVVRIEGNSFESSESNIQNELVSHQGNDTVIEATGNNFVNTSGFVFRITLGIEEQVSAPNNFWDVTDEFAISEKIQDGNDFPNSNIKFVEFRPFSLVRIDSAGINNN